MTYYSKTYDGAVQKFRNAAGDVEFYDKIMVKKIGHGPNKIVINSGNHGVEGFVGIAFQTKWLAERARFLQPSGKYQIVLIAAINGWGMANDRRENANNVDLNRNYVFDWNAPRPANEKYDTLHDLVTGKPGQSKMMRLHWLKKKHGDDGLWASLSRGQYTHPDGIFYGGNGYEPEVRQVIKIYDDIMQDADSMLSIGLHTGVGMYRSRSILVSHPAAHPSTRKFAKIFAPEFEIVTDENPAVMLSGDLVDFLELKYKNVPVWTADMEIGTGEHVNLSPVRKRCDQGDAAFEMRKTGGISERVAKNLRDNWYPKNRGWRNEAMVTADIFADKLQKYMGVGK